MPRTAEVKERIQRDLSGDLFDANHATRRFFRCWLDGSYKGYDHYQRNVAYLKEHHNNPRKLRSFVVCEFAHYTATDAHCSPSYAQRIIVQTISKNKLEKLNKHLVADALDLIEDFLQEEAA
jgi:hypothetical protein